MTHYGALTQLHTLAHHLLLTWLCTCALALQHNNGRDADFAVADQGLAIDDLVQVYCTTAEPTDLDVMATRIAQAACFEVLMQEDTDEVRCASYSCTRKLQILIEHLAPLVYIAQRCNIH